MIAASIFVVAGVENGAGLSLEVTVVCMAIIHSNMKTCEPMDAMTPLLYLIQCINDSLLERSNDPMSLCIQWINSMDQFNAITRSLHHSVPLRWSTLLLKRLIHMKQSHGEHFNTRLMDRSIETLCLEKQETVKSENPISRRGCFHKRKRARKRLYEETMINNFASGIN